VSPAPRVYNIIICYVISEHQIRKKLSIPPCHLRPVRSSRRSVYYTVRRYCTGVYSCIYIYVRFINNNNDIGKTKSPTGDCVDVAARMCYYIYCIVMDGNSKETAEMNSR